MKKKNIIIGLVMLLLLATFTFASEWQYTGTEINVPTAQQADIRGLDFNGTHYISSDESSTRNILVWDIDFNVTQVIDHSTRYGGGSDVLFSRDDGNILGFRELGYDAYNWTATGSYVGSFTFQANNNQKPYGITYNSVDDAYYVVTTTFSGFYGVKKYDKSFNFVSSHLNVTNKFTDIYYSNVTDNYYMTDVVAEDIYIYNSDWSLNGTHSFTGDGKLGSCTTQYWGITNNGTNWIISCQSQDKIYVLDGYDAPPIIHDVEFNSFNQTPEDINLTVVYEDLNINYDIGFAQPDTVYMNFTAYNSMECLIYVDGECDLYNSTYVSVDPYEINGDVYSFEREAYEYLGGTYNYDEGIMENLNKSVYTINNNDWIKIKLTNVSTIASYYYFEANVESEDDVDVFYCNDQYTTGNPILDEDCEFLGILSDSISHIHNLSYHRLLFFNSSSLNSTNITETSYFLIRGTSITQNLDYIDVDTDTSFISTNGGVSFAPLGYTMDAHIHFLDDNYTIQYEVCGVSNESFLTSCSDIIVDEIDIPLSIASPPAVSILFPSTGFEYNSGDFINITWIGTDVNGDNIFYTVTINDEFYLFETTVEYLYLDTSELSGDLNLEVTATDDSLQELSSSDTLLIREERPEPTIDFNICPTSLEGHFTLAFLTGIIILFMIICLLVKHIATKLLGVFLCLVMWFIGFVYMGCFSFIVIVFFAIGFFMMVIYLVQPVD